MLSKIQLIPLLSKRIEELEVTDLAAVIDAFNLGLSADEKKLEQLLEMAKRDDIDQVADLVKSPEQVAAFVKFFRDQEAVAIEEQNDGKRLVQCPHCEECHLV